MMYLKNGAVTLFLFVFCFGNPAEAGLLSPSLFDSGSRIGVGTTAPVSLLHVKGQGNSIEDVVYQQKIESTGNKVGLNFSHVGNGGVIGYANIGSGALSNVFYVSSGYCAIGRKGFIMDNEGRVVIGSTEVKKDDSNTPYTLTVHGGIWSKDLRIRTAKVDHLVVLPQHWADDVFDKNYPLLSIKELEENIHKNNHLPGIPSAKQVQDQGVSVGEMQSKLLRKVEELTLYIIEQNKRLNEQEKEIQKLKSQISG